MPKKTARYHAEVIQALSLGMGDTSLDPDDSDFDWRILAEGDSWFTIGAIPSSNLLMSGGGNDLIDQAADIIRATPTGTGKKPAHFVNAERLLQFQQGVQAGYRAIVALRDSDGSPNQGKPIVVHTYDYPTPRPAPATFLIVPITKPWMHPVFERYQVPKGQRNGVADILLDALADALLQLEKELPAFHVVDTRNVLVRADINAKGNSGDWLNEIHPNGDGYRKIANKLAAKLHKLL